MDLVRICIGVCLLAPAAAGAADHGAFLCRGGQPYEYVSAVADGDARLLFSLPRVSRAIALQRPAAPRKLPLLAHRAGTIAVPVQVDDGEQIDVYAAEVRVATLPGLMDGGDAVPGAMLVQTIRSFVLGRGSDPHDAGPQEIRQTVFGSDGRVLGERDVVEALNEDRRIWRLTSTGDGIYVQPSETNPATRIEVLDNRKFRPVTTITSDDGLKFTDVVMHSVDEGFAIGNGVVFLVAGGRIQALTTPQDRIRATRIEYDPRVQRALVQGSGGFWVFDRQGRKLLAQRSLSSTILTIDGHVAERLGATGETRLWRHTRGKGYGEPEPLDFPASANWNDVACMTARSAALVTRSGGKVTPAWIRFGQ